LNAQTPRPHEGDALKIKNLYHQMSNEREERRTADVKSKMDLQEKAIMALPTKFLNDSARAEFRTRVPTYRQLYFTPPRYKMTPFVSVKQQKMGGQTM
jgi:hypothetical protein